MPPRIRTYIPPSLLTETVLAQLAAVGKLSPAIAARAAGVAAAAELREELLGAPSPRRAAVASGGAEEGSGTAPPGGKTLLDELWELRLVEGALVCSRPQAAGTAPGRRARQHHDPGPGG